MPVFECARCNGMTYSASVGAIAPCETCGSDRMRVIDGGFDEARMKPRDITAGDHAALVYDDPNQVAPFCARYLTEGVDAGERVMAAIPGDLRTAVEQIVAPDVLVLIDWHDQVEIYGNFDADRIASTYEEIIRSEPRGTRILGGIDGLSTADASRQDIERCESLAHEIITALGAKAVCLYDSRSLPAELVDVAGRRHGLCVDEGLALRNERFEYAPA